MDNINLERVYSVTVNVMNKTFQCSNTVNRQNISVHILIIITFEYLDY